MADTIDFCILGAGLAGVSLAGSLAGRDLSTAVVDRSSIAAGASGTPGALVNPATGRRATKSWRAEACYEAILANLQEVGREVNPAVPFYGDNGILRPAQTRKMARKMKEQHEKTSWREGWCIWKSEAEIKEIHPGIHCVDGGLWLPIGLSVNAGQYLSAYASRLESRGVDFFLNGKPEVRPDRNYWIIETGSTRIRSKNLVYATGFHIRENRYWDWLPIHPVKGQIAEFELVDDSLSFSHSISSLGYISRIGKKDSFFQGSTYEHDFTDLKPDREGEQYLRKRMRRTLPRLEPNVRLKSQWAGVRASTPNRKPVIGTHPEKKNLHVFTGLGSKGLLYSRFLAEHLTDYLLGSAPVYREVSVDRFAN